MLVASVFKTFIYNKEARLCHHTQIMGANNLSSFYTKTWFSSHDILPPPRSPHHGENRKQDAARPDQARQGGSSDNLWPLGFLVIIKFIRAIIYELSYLRFRTEQISRYGSRLPWCRHIAKNVKSKVSRDIGYCSLPSLTVFSCFV